MTKCQTVDDATAICNYLTMSISDTLSKSTNSVYTCPCVANENVEMLNSQRSCVIAINFSTLLLFIAQYSVHEFAKYSIILEEPNFLLNSELVSYFVLYFVKY